MKSKFRIVIHKCNLCKKRVEENDSKFIFHGHRHNPNPEHWKNHFNVCVDQHDYKPLELSQLIEELNLQKFL